MPAELPLGVASMRLRTVRLVDCRLDDDSGEHDTGRAR
jgi:hypothetical protein